MTFNIVQYEGTKSVKGHFTHEPKRRDHAIGRAQKYVFKGCPNTPPKSCSVVTDPPSVV
jgi:hypothetical protein